MSISSSGKMRSLLKRGVVLFICLLVTALPTQGIQAEDFNQPLTWTQKLSFFELNHFNNRAEVYEFSKSLLNQVEDDDRLKYSEKKKLRVAISELEDRLASRLPELKLVGFKRTLIEKGNPNAGTILEPEYQ